MHSLASLRETFFQECDDQLTELESGLSRMEEREHDAETVNAVFRAVHSIKGGAGAFQLDQLVRFAHVFETVLDLIRHDAIELTPHVSRTLFRSADLLRDLVAAARAGGTLDDQKCELLERDLAQIAERGSMASDETRDCGSEFQPIAIALDALRCEPEQTPRIVDIAFAPRPELYRNGNESLRLLRELEALGSVARCCDYSTVPSLDRLDPHESYLSWRIELTTDADIAAVREIFDFVEDECELSIVERRAGNEPAPTIEQASSFDEPADGSLQHVEPDGDSRHAAPGRPTIRVDLDRLDRLINLVGELVINQAVLAQHIDEAGFSRSSEVVKSLAALEQLTREIQEGVMATRAQPVRPLFQRMARVVREVAEATGKSVRLRCDGEATELDRTVIESLVDPLTHMIRNAIDHGLERPDERAAAKKPLQGEVRLSAIHRSGRVIMEVSDDGAGIDRARVRKIAEEKELVAPDLQMSDSEIDNLIFLPGFSTAATLSNISGRGVGMDVVKRSIQSVGGRVSIASVAGRGSTFTMSLPLTLAVLDGMVVRAGDQTLVVPLTAIVETLRPRVEDVRGLGTEARVLAYRGGFTPLIEVSAMLGFRAAPFDPATGVVLIVETEASSRCALALDEIFDQRQVVMKSLERNYRRVPGIAAATILGDGRVALILDIQSLMAESQTAAAASIQFVA